MRRARFEALHIDNVSHRYGAAQILHEVDLKIAPGQIVGLVGPSGCGKSTLLNTIVGTLRPTVGSVRLLQGGDHPNAVAARARAIETHLALDRPEDVRIALSRLDDASLRTKLSSVEYRRIAYAIVTRPGRDRGIVHQRYALFPHLTARANVALGLELQHPLWERLLRPVEARKRKREYLARAQALLEKLKMGHAGDRFPHQLSGGMCQRVAIAQALITKPSVLLLDEPFGALDEATREELQRMLLMLYAENQAAVAANEHPPYTILIVTHELNEAIFVGDRVIGLSQYWDWANHGFAKCPGATIVYDNEAPVFAPDAELDPHLIREQRLTILGAVFDAKPQERRALVRSWEPTENPAGAVS